MRVRLAGLRWITAAGLPVLSLFGCASVEERQSFEDWTTVDRARPVRAGVPAEEQQLPALNDHSSLGDYLAYAALNNPGLEAAFYRWKAALERVPQVRSLPDPKFTYRYFIREVETRVGPQQQAFSLAQTFPWLGKLELRGTVALEEAKAARQQYEGEKLALFYRVKDAYYELYYLARAMAVVRENRDLLKYIEGVARTRYKAAAANHPDVIRAQVEMGKLDDQLRTLEDLRAPITAKLNAALNRPAHMEIPWPQAIPEELIDTTDEQVLAYFRENNPELKGLDHEIDRARQAIQLARKDYFPDLTLGVDYIDVGTGPRSSGPGLSAPFAQRSAKRLLMGGGDGLDAYNIARSYQANPRPDDAGQDVWAVSLSMNVPIWWGKYSAGEREARARLSAAVQEKRDRDNALSADIKQVLYDLRDASRKIDLYRDTLVPKGRQALRAMEAAFRSGSAGFLDLIDSERVLLEFELSYERALASHAQRLAEVEMLVGRPIPRQPAMAGPLPEEGGPVNESAQPESGD